MSVLEGRYPSKTFGHLGSTLTMRTTKQAKTTMTRTVIIISKSRRGFPRCFESLSKSMKTTSNAVSITAADSGSLGNNSTSPMAEPRSSARSVLIIATSDKT